MHLKCLEKSFIPFLRIRLRRGVFIIAEITDVTIINVERILPWSIMRTDFMGGAANQDSWLALPAFIFNLAHGVNAAIKQC